MKTFDWIVVGAGLTGAAASYELAKCGFSVLLLEQHEQPRNATRYSYGGIAYWSGTTALTQSLCKEVIERHRILSVELDADTQFRELDLLLTVAAGNDPEKVAAPYAACAIPPRRLSVEEACEMEPLLNGDAIAAAFTVRHGHVAPEAIVAAYLQAFLRAGGVVQITKFREFVREGNRIFGVKTDAGETYHAASVLVCAGGIGRTLLKAAGITTRLYFTHAELIETPTVDVRLSTLVMPAEMPRVPLESQSSAVEVDRLWDEPGNEPMPPIMEPGAIQFLNGSLRIGQISRVLTDPNAKVDAAASESEIRGAVGEVLPALKNLPGTWYSCLVAFSPDPLPLVGAFSDIEGVQVFSGFGSPFAYVPAIAQRFAKHAAGQHDEIITQLSPLRFAV